MNRRFFVSGMIVALTLACFAQPPAFSKPAGVLVGQENKGTLYKIDAAGVQLNVPAGWKIEKDKDGVTLSKIENDSYIVIALTALAADAASLTPEEQFKYFSEGVFSNASNDFKELKKTDVSKSTQNGIDATSQSFQSKADGVDMAGLIILMNTSRPLGVFAYGTAKISDAFNGEVTQLFTSIKKIAAGGGGESAWIKYNPPEGRYSVLLPTQPDVQKNSSNQVQIMSVLLPGTYSVAYFDLTAEQTYSLDDWRNGQIKDLNGKGTVLADRQISVSGYPGRELITLEKESGDNRVGMQRIFKADNRIYIVLFTYLKSAETEAVKAQGAKFYDSFQIVKP
jgi:hypothetical protein